MIFFPISELINLLGREPQQKLATLMSLKTKIIYHKNNSEEEKNNGKWIQIIIQVPKYKEIKFNISCQQPYSNNKIIIDNNS